MKDFSRGQKETDPSQWKCSREWNGKKKGERLSSAEKKENVKGAAPTCTAKSRVPSVLERRSPVPDEEKLGVHQDWRSQVPRVVQSPQSAGEVHHLRPGRCLLAPPFPCPLQCCPVIMNITPCFSPAKLIRNLQQNSNRVCRLLKFVASSTEI